jgi:hypothetical protein
MIVKAFQARLICLSKLIFAGGILVVDELIICFLFLVKSLGLLIMGAMSSYKSWMSGMLLANKYSC